MEVHKEAREILAFWLEETPAERRFDRDEKLDAEIQEKFGELREAVVRTDAEGWTEEPHTLLAAIILIDQFSRNLYRDSPKAFQGDAMARRLTRLALDRQWDEGMTQQERQFLYMPLMHSEDIADQSLCVQLFKGLDDPLSVDFAERHRQQIERFGRFPQRNPALGRKSTAEEIAFLKQDGAHF